MSKMGTTSFHWFAVSCDLDNIFYSHALAQPRFKQHVDPMTIATEVRNVQFANNFPFAVIYEELAAAYPRAQLVHHVRHLSNWLPSHLRFMNTSTSSIASYEYQWQYGAVKPTSHEQLQGARHILMHQRSTLHPERLAFVNLHKQERCEPNGFLDAELKAIMNLDPRRCEPFPHRNNRLNTSEVIMPCA